MSNADRDKWNAKYRDAGGLLPEPSRVVTALADDLPRNGRALDIAGGTGRHSIWLARHGLQVTLADISENGLQAARRLAEIEDVSIETLCVDFEDQPLPSGPWDVILSVLYMPRELFPQFHDALVPGGRLVILQPTKKNLERHEKPPERFLLDDGELPGLVEGLKVIQYREGWLEDGRHDALVVARRLS